MKSVKRLVLDLSSASIASISATAIDGIIYAVLVWTLVAWGNITIGVAAAVAAIVGGAIHYFLSRFWVFERFNAPLKQSALVYFAMSWLAAACHGALTGVLTTSMGLSGGWLASKALVWMFWIYPISRYVVFGGLGARKPKHAVEGD